MSPSKFHVTLGVAFAALLVALVPACGSDDADNGSSGASGTPAKTGVIGAAGGTVNGPDGASIEIPPGALAADTTISIRVAASNEPPALPAEQTLRSKVFAFEPHGLAFKVPATIKLPLTAPKGADETLEAFHASPGGAWTPLEASIAADARITTSSFSFFGIFFRGGAVTKPKEETCLGRSNEAAPPSNVAGSGSVTHDGRTISVTSLQSGVAVKGPNPPDDSEEVRIQLHTFGNACGRLRGGMAKKDDPFVAFFARSLPGTKLEPRVYGGVLLETSAVKEGQPGACNFPQAIAGNRPKGSLTLTAVDANHIAGTIRAAAPGEPEDPPTIVITFDVPFCSAKSGQTPTICCIP